APGPNLHALPPRTRARKGEPANARQAKKNNPGYFQPQNPKYPAKRSGGHFQAIANGGRPAALPYLPPGHSGHDPKFPKSRNPNHKGDFNSLRGYNNAPRSPVTKTL